MERRRGRRVVVGAVVVVALAAAAIVQQRSLRDLRRVEAVYVAGRQVTACANDRLKPFAESGPGGFEFEDIDRAVDRLVLEAAAESKQVRARFDDVDVMPLPSLRRARAEVRTALRAQVTLYEALIDDPAGSDDELLTLGRSNNRAERRLARARSVLLVGKPTGWDRRFTCRAEPPAAETEAQASSSSSSSSM